METVWGGDEAALIDYRLEIDGSVAESNWIMSGAILRLYVLAMSKAWPGELQFGIASDGRMDSLFTAAIPSCDLRLFAAGMSARR